MQARTQQKPFQRRPCAFSQVGQSHGAGWQRPPHLKVNGWYPFTIFVVSLIRCARTHFVHVGACHSASLPFFSRGMCASSEASCNQQSRVLRPSSLSLVRIWMHVPAHNELRNQSRDFCPAQDVPCMILSFAFHSFSTSRLYSKPKETSECNRVTSSAFGSPDILMPSPHRRWLALA